MTAQELAVRALDALEVGDVRLVETILLGALEDGQYLERVRCPDCGQGFEWPGLLEAHACRAHVGPAEVVAPPAAWLKLLRSAA